MLAGKAVIAPHAAQKHKKNRLTAFDIALYLIMLIVVIITIYPFWHELVISLDGSSTVNVAGIKLFPHELSFDAYRVVLNYYTLWRSFGWAIYRVVLGTFLTILMNMLTAYPLSKKDLPFRKACITYLFITMLIGGGLIPNYLLVRYLGMMNTYWALVVPGCVSAYNIFVVNNFYKSQPQSIEESAMIDGAGWLTIWIRLVIPLSGPIIAVIGLWSAVGHWNAWFDVQLYIMSASRYTLPAVLRKILIDTSSNNATAAEFQALANQAISGTQLQGKSVEAAITMVSIIPMLILYPFLQKYFVKGINIGSIKE